MADIGNLHTITLQIMRKIIKQSTSQIIIS